MAKGECPVPGCAIPSRVRQVYVNTHLREYHGIAIDAGKAGNLKLLRENQQKTFSSWLKTNGYENTDLFSGQPIRSTAAEEDEDPASAEEDFDNDDEIVVAPRSQRAPAPLLPKKGQKARDNGLAAPAPLSRRKRQNISGQPASNTSQGPKLASRLRTRAQTALSGTELAEQADPDAADSDDEGESQAEPKMGPPAKKRRIEVEEENVFVGQDRARIRDAAIQASGMYPGQEEARIAEIRRQLPLLEQQYEQGRELAQRALVARHQLQDQVKALQSQVKALEFRKMMLDAQIPGTETHNFGSAPRGPTGLHQAPPAGQLRAAIPNDPQSQAERRGAITDLSAGEPQRQFMAPGAGTIQARPAENVKRAQVEQLERQLLQAPPTFRPYQSHEERSRQIDQELIIRLPDRAENEVGAVDEASFDPLEQWQSPQMFPQVAQYGDEMGDKDMFHEPMDLE